MSIFGGMKTNIKLLVAGLSLVFTFACTQKAPNPAPTGDVKIGYVRLDSVLELYDLHNELVAELEAKAKKAQAELIRSEQNLQTEYSILEKAAPKLSKLELERAQIDFQRVSTKHQELTQLRNEELAQEESKIQVLVLGEVRKAVVKLQEDTNMDFIFIYESNLLYGSDAFDLTTQLAQLLNAAEKPMTSEKEEDK